MYSFEPTEEQKMLIDAIGHYALNDLRAKAHEADEEKMLPPILIEKGWELGYLQASIPEAYGGFGERSVVTGVLAAEAMAWETWQGNGCDDPGCSPPYPLAGSEQQNRNAAQVIEAEWQPILPP
jgi:acyl-CoA dehydrogenase